MPQRPFLWPSRASLLTVYASHIDWALMHLLDFVSRQLVDIVLLYRRPWKSNAKTISRWVKSLLPSARIILLSETLLMPEEIPANIDAFISHQASAELITNTIAPVLPVTPDDLCASLDSGLA